ncbi:MAG: hypothetical protein WKF30_16805 [Pyrinomonadaceae bacterium]
MSTTNRLYYGDSHLTEFEASVVAIKATPTGVILNRTAFYPTGGGQPTDLRTRSDFVRAHWTKHPHLRQTS